MVLTSVCAVSVAACRGDDANDRYLLLNVAAPEIQSDTMRAIKQLGGAWTPGRPRAGVGAIISYFRQSPEKASEQLRRLLTLCEEHELAVIVQLDGEQWWKARPDLWNWWDKERPGYDPANAANVEWSGWGPEHCAEDRLA